MAHNIDISTGAPAIAYTGTTPWHGLGERLQEGESIEGWLKAARLNWEISMVPVQYIFKSQPRIAQGRFVLMRSDTGDALSVVSGAYNIVQPKEVLEFYRDLVDSQGYTLETAGALDSGRKVWALAKTNEVGIVGADERDRIAAYLLLATSCDKTLATTVAFTSVRVVCQNTLFFAIEGLLVGDGRHVKVSHNYQFDAKATKETLGLVRNSWDSFTHLVSQMAERQLDQSESKAFFDALFPRNKRNELSAKAAREFSSLVSLYGNAPGQDLSSAKGTLWGAVNAVTYFADHVQEAGKKGRLDSAWFGKGRVLKEEAWAEALRILGQTN